MPAYDDAARRGVRNSLLRMINGDGCGPRGARGADAARAAAAAEAEGCAAALRRCGEELRAATLRAERAEALCCARGAGACVAAARRERDAARAALGEERRAGEALREEVGRLRGMCAGYARAIAGAFENLNAAQVRVRGGAVEDSSAVGGLAFCEGAVCEGAVCEGAGGGEAEAGSEVDENVLREVSVQGAAVRGRAVEKAGKPRAVVEVRGLKVVEVTGGVREMASSRGGACGARREVVRGLETSFQNLFWCPPGTPASTLVSTVHKDQADRVQVMELACSRWADGAALWYDISSALIPAAGQCYDPPAGGSEDFWCAVESAFLSVQTNAGEEAPAPIVFVLRDAGLLAPYKDDPGCGSAYEACEKIARVVHVLSGIRDALETNRFSVSVILEGWPAAILLGRHVARSLALPRVSGRVGRKPRHRNQFIQIIA